MYSQLPSQQSSQFFALLQRKPERKFRQSIPKGTDFSSLTDAFIRKIQHKLNRRPLEKLNFESPLKVFFPKVANFAVVSR